MHMKIKSVMVINIIVNIKIQRVRDINWVKEMILDGDMIRFLVIMGG